MDIRRLSQRRPLLAISGLAGAADVRSFQGRM
ncbi:hypothetical protein JOD67_006732 [Tenggerimyces flavus]|nr:hypothetical protein [Tenggerimyces flavus]